MMVGPLGESLVKAGKEGRLKPMSKAEVDEWRARMAAIPEEEVARGLKRIQEDVDNSSLDDWGV
jgi:hypothetical protein